MWEQLIQAGIPCKYESLKIRFIEPAKPRHYLPDFQIGNLIIETKGRLTAYDRKKHLLVREQNPELDIRFVFQKSSNKLYKNSPTTYAEWCVKNNFKYADKLIPEEWLQHECS